MGIIQELFYNTKFEFHKQMSREGTECISVQVRSEERPRGSRSVPCPPSPRALYTCPCLGGVGREDGEAERWECIWEDKHSCWRILSIELDYHFRNDCNAWKTLKLEDDRIASHFNPPPSRQSNGVLQVRQEAIYKRERATLTAPVSLQRQVGLNTCLMMGSLWISRHWTCEKQSWPKCECHWQFSLTLNIFIHWIVLTIGDLW